jgi:hypothetical protein
MTWLWIILVLVGVVCVLVAILGEAQRARSRGSSDETFRWFRSG